MFDDLFYDIGGGIYGLPAEKYMYDYIFPHSPTIRFDTTFRLGYTRLFQALPSSVTAHLVQRNSMYTTVYRVPNYDYYVELLGDMKLPCERREQCGDDYLCVGSGFGPEYDRLIIRKGRSNIKF